MTPEIRSATYKPEQPLEINPNHGLNNLLGLPEESQVDYNFSLRRLTAVGAIAGLGAAGIATGLITGAEAPSANAATPAYNLNKGPNLSNKIILTFDDCPKSLWTMKTTSMKARQLGIGLVLAPTGDCVKSGRFDAKFARANGQYVINHSVSHPNLTKLSLTGVRRQLDPPGIDTNYGRPPYGAYNSTVKKAYSLEGMKIWNWTVDTNDWRGKTRSNIVSYVANNSKAGDTVLMHMQWNAFNPSGLDMLKSALKARGKNVCQTSPTIPTPIRLPDSLPC